MSTRSQQASMGKHWMLIGLMLQGTMDLLDVGMFNVAMPSIQAEYGLAVETLSLVVAIRYIARIGLMPIYGLLGDRLGKKRVLVGGLATFGLGSLFCLFSTSLTFLVIGRILQGAGGGILPISMAIISDHFPSGQRGRVLGTWNAAAPVGAIVGPPLGGVIIESFGWKSIFVLVGVGSMIALTLALRLIPASANNNSQSSADWFGAFWLFTLATGLLLATTTSSVFHMGSNTNLFFWTITIAALVFLIWHGSKNKDALLNRDVLRNSRLTLPSLAMIFRMFSLTGVRFLLVLYLANVYSKSPSAVGLFMIFHSITLFIGIPIGGYLADRWTCKKAAGLGMLIQSAGMVALSLAGPQTGDLSLIPGMLLGGFGAGLSLTPFNKGAIVSLGEQNTGRAAGLYNMVRFTGTASSAPLLGLILAAGFAQLGGLETSPEPYQNSFFILAGCALLGAGIASLIPPPLEEEVQAQEMLDATS